VSRCFATLRQLRHLRHHITNDCLRSLVVLLVHSRLDYGQLRVCRTSCLSPTTSVVQTVLNAAARLVFRLRRYDHVSDALAILYWLRLPERVNFKLALKSWHTECWTVWRHRSLSESTRSGIKPARSSPSTVVVHAAAARPAVYRLSTVAIARFLSQLPFSGTLWQTTVCLFILATVKYIPVSPVISGHHSLNFRTTLSWTLQQFRLFLTFSHAKNLWLTLTLHCSRRRYIRL